MGLCVKKNKSQYMGVLGYPIVWDGSELLEAQDRHRVGFGAHGR